jgi:protein kinase N
MSMFPDTKLTNLNYVWQVAYEQADLMQRPSGRGLEYRDSAYESRRHSQFSGMSMDNFRLLSVLGRGHFGKVKMCIWMLK